MAGIAGDNMVFPILDLIEQRLKEHKCDENGNPIMWGYPSVQLFREHEMDEDRVTRAIMTYDSGYAMEVQMTFGSDDESTYPTTIDEAYFDYEYYKYFRLTHVQIILTKISGATVANYSVVLHYNEKGLLTSTTATRIN